MNSQNRLTHSESATNGDQAIEVGNWEAAIAHYLKALYELWNNVGEPGDPSAERQAT